jgi:hypothetical protein
MFKKEKKDNNQLDLNLKESPLNSIAKYKERFGLMRAKWDIRKYTKSSWVWFTIVISISLIITQVVTILENINILPNKIPILKIYIEANSTLASTEYIYLLPSLSFLILFIGILFSNRYYNKERDLSNTLLWTVLLSNLIMTVSLIRLINIY